MLIRELVANKKSSIEINSNTLEQIQRG